MSKKQQQTNKKASDLLLRLFISERPKQTKLGGGGGGGGKRRERRKTYPFNKEPAGYISPSRGTNETVDPPKLKYSRGLIKNMVLVRIILCMYEL